MAEPQIVPLTPALSPTKEKERFAAALEKATQPRCLPLPEGEGRGEGEERVACRRMVVLSKCAQSDLNFDQDAASLDRDLTPRNRRNASWI